MKGGVGMSQTYESPVLDITVFAAEDVITASGGGGNTLPPQWDE